MQHRFSPLALCALAACHAAAAQTPASPAPAPTVEISARAGSADTASKTVITSAQIRRQGAGRLLDVLKRVPGITVAGGLRMRGLGDGYLQILLNGEAAPSGFSLESVTPESIERIEISRAPAAEHSARGIAGTINLVLRRIVSKSQRDLRLSAAGEHGRPAGQAALTLAERKGGVSWVLAGGAMSSRSARDTTLTERVGGARSETIRTERTDQGRSESVDIAPRVTWQLDGGHTLSWQSFVQLRRSASLGLAASEGENGAQPLFGGMQTRGSTSNRVARSSVNWLQRLDRQASLEVSLGANGARRDQDAQFVGQPAAHGAPVHQDAIRNATDSGATSKGKYTFPANGSHTLVLGWEGARNARAEEREQARQIGSAAPVASASASRVRVRRLAAFGQDEWNLERGWSVYLGLRWEQVRTVSGERGMEQVANQYAVCSPIVQTLWKLPDSPGTQVRLALARTYEAPAPQTLIGRRIESADNKAASPDFQGNPGLRPTLSWGADLGLEHDAGTGLTFSANAYARRLSDIAARTLRFTSGRWVVMVDNNGSASTRGMDADARLARSFARGALSSLELRAGVARNWSRVDNVRGPHNRLEGQVAASASLGADMQLRRAPLALGGQFSFQAGGTAAGSDDDSTWTSASRVLDVYAMWKVDARSRLRLELSNALAQPGEIVATLRDGAELHSQAVRTAGSRTLRLSWEYGGW